jgi:putative transposase
MFTVTTFFGELKRYLAKEQKATAPFDPYKFTGDGWLLLFPANTDGVRLLRFLENLCLYFVVEFRRSLLPHLSHKPALVGITFGIDKGEHNTLGSRTKRKRQSIGLDRWHLDEVYLSINGKLQYLWRAVDQDGEVLDILVQPLRDRQAAKKFFRKLLQRLQYIPRALITDKLGSYAAAKADVLPGVEHIQDKGSNNRAGNSHQPTRERERRMRGFKSAGHAQRFLATFGVTAAFFPPGRHLLTARNYREVMRRRFRQWSEAINPGFASQCNSSRQRRFGENSQLVLLSPT